MASAALAILGTWERYAYAYNQMHTSLGGAKAGLVMLRPHGFREVAEPHSQHQKNIALVKTTSQLNECERAEVSVLSL